MSGLESKIPVENKHFGGILSIVYILTNEAMPGYIKIGRTGTSVEQRMRELDKTSTPRRFSAITLLESMTTKNSREHFTLHSAITESAPAANSFGSTPTKLVSS